MSRRRPFFLDSSPPPAARCVHDHLRLTGAGIDEPAEVAVVEKQLLEHLDLDPTVTFNVLCDQVVPTDDSLDDEDQAVRDRLRAF